MEGKIICRCWCSPKIRSLCSRRGFGCPPRQAERFSQLIRLNIIFVQTCQCLLSPPSPASRIRFNFILCRLVSAYHYQALSRGPSTVARTLRDYCTPSKAKMEISAPIIFTARSQHGSHKIYHGDLRFGLAAK